LKTASIWSPGPRTPPAPGAVTEPPAAPGHRCSWVTAPAPQKPKADPRLQPQAFRCSHHSFNAMARLHHAGAPRPPPPGGGFFSPGKNKFGPAGDGGPTAGGAPGGGPPGGKKPNQKKKLPPLGLIADGHVTPHHGRWLLQAAWAHSTGTWCCPVMPSLPTGSMEGRHRWDEADVAEVEGGQLAAGGRPAASPCQLLRGGGAAGPLSGAPGGRSPSHRAATVGARAMTRHSMKRCMWDLPWARPARTRPAPERSALEAAGPGPAWSAGSGLGRGVLLKNMSAGCTHVSIPHERCLEKALEKAGGPRLSSTARL